MELSNRGWLWLVLLCCEASASEAGRAPVIERMEACMILTGSIDVDVYSSVVCCRMDPSESLPVLSLDFIGNQLDG